MPLPGGSFVASTLDPATGTGGRLLLYSGATLTDVPVPQDEYPESVVALPGGGYAVGTAAQAACNPSGCTSATCRAGAVGIAAAGETPRWYTVSLAGAAPREVFGSPEDGDPPCAIDVGTLAAGRLWYGVNGVGVGALDLHTGTSRLVPGNKQVRFAGNGPVQILGVAGDTVYFAVHRLPGVADAGYWGPLAAIDVTTETVRTYMPASTDCIQGGAGTPRALTVDGTRVWAQWGGSIGWCPPYQLLPGAAELTAPAAGCISTQNLGVTTMFEGNRVYEACRTADGVDFHVLDGSTGTPLARFGWPAALTARGVVPDGQPTLWPDGTSSLTVTVGVKNTQDTLLLRLDLTGTVQATYALPPGTVPVPGDAGPWLVSPSGVTLLN